MKPKIIFFGTLVIIVCIVFSSFYIHQKTTQKNNLPLVRVIHGQYVEPLFVAQEKGYFDDAGINVEMMSFPSNNTATQALAKGDADVSSFSYSALFPFEKASPGNFKIFCGLTETKDYPYSYFIVKDTIHSVEDLKGKKIVTRSGSNGRLQAEMIVHALHINPDEYELVQVEQELIVPTFATKDIAGAIVLEPYAAAITVKKLGKILISAVRAKYIADPYPSSNLIFGTKFIQRDKESAEKYRLAINRAIDFMRSHEKESKLIVAKYLKLDEQVALTMTLPKFEKLEEIDKRAIENEMNLEYEQGLLKEKVDFSNVYYSFNK